jgi:hypothetical protein
VLGSVRESRTNHDTLDRADKDQVEAKDLGLVCEPRFAGRGTPLHTCRSIAATVRISQARSIKVSFKVLPVGRRCRQCYFIVYLFGNCGWRASARIDTSTRRDAIRIPRNTIYFSVLQLQSTDAVCRCRVELSRKLIYTVARRILYGFRHHVRARACATLRTSPLVLPRRRHASHLIKARSPAVARRDVLDQHHYM